MKALVYRIREKAKQLFHRFSKVFGYRLLEASELRERSPASEILPVGQAINAEVPKAQLIDDQSSEAPELGARQIRYAATCVYRLPKGEFPEMTILSNGAVLLKKRSLLSTGLGSQDGSVFAALAPDRRKTRSERVIVAPFPHNWHGTYGDFLLTILPRICRTWAEIPPDQRREAVLAYPLLHTAWENALLSQLGVSHQQMVDTRLTRVEATPDGVVYCPNGEDALWAERSAHPSDYQIVRAALCPPPASSPTRRLYLRRVGRRSFVNEEAILPILREHGFESIDLGSLPVTEQIRLCQQSAVILGIHGANLVNMLWCSPGTTVVEFFGRGFRPTFYRQMAFSLGLHYRYWAEAPMAQSDYANVNWDLKGDPLAFRRFVQELDRDVPP